MIKATQAQLSCDRCGASKNDAIAPCKRFYQTAEEIICDRCKEQNQWTDLQPVIWVEAE